MFQSNGLSKIALLFLPCFVLGFQPQIQAGSSNSLMDIRPDGKLLAVANPDCGTVTIVDLEAKKAKFEIKVGKKPEGVTWDATGKIVLATVYGHDSLAVIDAENGKLLQKISVADEPYGVVLSPGGKRFYVTHDYLGLITEWDAASYKLLRTFTVAPFLRGLAIDAKGESLFATGFFNGRLYRVDVASGNVVDTWKGHTTDNLCRSVTLNPNKERAFLPHVRSRIEVIDGSGSIFPQVTVYSFEKGAEGSRRNSIAMDSFNAVQVVTNPWEGAFSPDGKNYFVIYSATDDMNACSVRNDDNKEIEGRGYPIQVGRNPRAVRVSPDGHTVWVYAAMDFSVNGFDAQSMRPVGKIPVCQEKPDEKWVLGKYLFGSARQPMTGPRWVSCFSCHPDGHTDGRVWHNPEGLRKTPAMFGLAHTHPLHWSADRDEVQDFEYTIRGRLMKGRGLVDEVIPFKKGVDPVELRSKMAGRSEKLDALAIYTNSFEVETLSPHILAPGKLTEKAARGKILFESPMVGCAQCHSGPYFTDSNLTSPKVHDVGTGSDDPSEKMGPKYDTPSLIGAYRTAPYLHHGKAATLADLLTKNNPGDKHGKTSQLKANEVDDLVEFLKSIPYEFPPRETANSVKYRLIGHKENNAVEK